MPRDPVDSQGSEKKLITLFLVTKKDPGKTFHTPSGISLLPEMLPQAAQLLLLSSLLAYILQKYLLWWNWLAVHLAIQIELVAPPFLIPLIQMNAMQSAGPLHQELRSWGCGTSSDFMVKGPDFVDLISMEKSFSVVLKDKLCALIWILKLEAFERFLTIYKIYWSAERRPVFPQLGESTSPSTEQISIPWALLCGDERRSQLRNWWKLCQHVLSDIGGFQRVPSLQILGNHFPVPSYAQEVQLLSWQCQQRGL